MITFNKPYATGKEFEYIRQAIEKKWLAGNGDFTKQCQQFLEARYKIPKVLLTTSCTGALEMMAILLDVKEGDEVIMPSYTFVSTANAFVLRGANIVFADSRPDHPNLDAEKVAALITPKTKAILAVHYAGMACELDKLRQLCNEHGICLLEDAAQAIESEYKNKPVGTFGEMAALSFHETKNIISGEGGALLINDPEFIKRAEIIWEKGTNRTAFFRGEVDKYSWVDVGSSFLPSELNAAYLWAQLEEMENIQAKRQSIWNQYFETLRPMAEEGFFELPLVPDDVQQNYHLFYLLCQDQEERDALIAYLKNREIQAVFHYLPLHKSPYFREKHDGRQLSNCERYGETLVRLPFYNELSATEVGKVCTAIQSFYEAK